MRVYRNYELHSTAAGFCECCDAGPQTCRNIASVFVYSSTQFPYDPANDRSWVEVDMIGGLQENHQFTVTCQGTLVYT